jgi:hypothetical protein
VLCCVEGGVGHGGPPRRVRSVTPPGRP